MEAFEHLQTAKGPSLFLLPDWMARNEELTVGFTGRGGGVSKAPWSSFNMGLHVGDQDHSVIANRRLLTEAIGWPFDAWTCAEQVHGNVVHQVVETDKGRGRDSLSDVIKDCDAIMTDVPGVLLASFYADCVPLYFYDPVHNAVALAHAGWKGTVQQIAKVTVEAMGDAYGSAPNTLLAAIGPSISGCCYEVDGVVIDQVQQLTERLGLEGEVTDHMLKRSENGKANLYLKEINRQIMIKAGILPIHIELTQWCTGCRRDLFFSHRKEGGLTGRMASWIGIRER
ncbi:multicopper polyphenol oxidase [Paenibacillus sp. FSL H8-0548]|uniref:peptidoglycan editing factor PgeF n=1 Tax=Paenibacillus sp. FSL H8-0548 TaxID=1920422 RepID=UPI00096C34A4|nr:peptidoglycan editing factor PgeF [Paenibacillus sp. FSL H8-0548]OMF22765.1 multicopper polyphenol oxidase [Paenibacillus sp. FSL H8-0548]